MKLTQCFLDEFGIYALHIAYFTGSARNKRSSYGKRTETDCG